MTQFRTFTHAEAFAPTPGEVSVGIDYRDQNFSFTRGWFRVRNQATWSSKLLPEFGDGRPVRMVQIGVFEGMDLVWCCQNLLKHPNSRAVAIDPWAATTKLDAVTMEDVCSRAYRNLYPWRRKVEVMRGYSNDVLPTLDEGAFDLLIVDGDHNSLPVLQDAVNCLRLAKMGGLLVFDDVRNRVKKKDHVEDGLRMFVEQHGPRIEFAWAHRYADAYRKVR